jgi:Holliday junction resolvase
MTPSQFEKKVGEYFQSLGYQVEYTPSTGDYGVDIFATKGEEKIAIQCKMYGNSTRKVNRAMVMELHGAKEYFDCTASILATNGTIQPDALVVAKKLKVNILDFNKITFKAQPKVLPSLSLSVLPKKPPKKSDQLGFDEIWEHYIIPLKGKTLTRSDGKSNKIVNVDWAGVERITSNGKPQCIKIEIFRLAINKILNEGYISRDEINQNYVGRASSGVILILSQVPAFILTTNPIGLKKR